MFPSLTTTSQTRRSLRELLRGAAGTALEFATLGEASMPGTTTSPPAPPTHVAEHPHRVALRRPTRPRRPGAVPARAQVCTAPVPVKGAPARHAA
jgi:hypothetical protein